MLKNTENETGGTSVARMAYYLTYYAKQNDKVLKQVPQRERWLLYGALVRNTLNIRNTLCKRSHKGQPHKTTEEELPT